MWSVLDWPVYRNQILIYLNISVFYLYSQCSRQKFSFLFQLQSYTAEKVFFNISLAINMASQHSYCKFHFFCCFSIFLLSFRNAQNTQNVNEKAWILMDNPWKFKSNAVLSLKCRGMLTILSNICNKGFSKIVNGVQRDYNVRDQHNGAHTLKRLCEVILGYKNSLVINRNVLQRSLAFLSSILVHLMLEEKHQFSLDQSGRCHG